jgi:acyl-CoA thioesterase-2
VSEALDLLVELLDLEAIEVNIFRGVSPDEHRQRVFGGQVAGQALVAAGRTVDPDRRVHSLHAYFLRPGDPTVPILYDVDRIRDGKSFTTRRVVAIQHGRAIFNLAASFHVTEDGPEHQIEPPDVPGPDELPTMQQRMEPYRDRLGDWYDRGHPIDMRYVTPTPIEREWEKLPPRQHVWIRADGALPDDPLLHACVVAYASDFTLLDTTVLAHGLPTWTPDAALMMASLDHAMWFHRPFRADRWMLYDMESPSSYGGRGLGVGHIYSHDGDLVVSVVQEGLLRPVRR